MIIYWWVGLSTMRGDVMPGGERDVAESAVDENVTLSGNFGNEPLALSRRVVFRDAPFEYGLTKLGIACDVECFCGDV